MAAARKHLKKHRLVDDGLAMLIQDAGGEILGEPLTAAHFIGGAMIPVTFAASFLMFPREWRNNISVLMGLVATMAPTAARTCTAR